MDAGGNVSCNLHNGVSANVTSSFGLSGYEAIFSETMQATTYVATGYVTATSTESVFFSTPGPQRSGFLVTQYSFGYGTVGAAPYQFSGSSSIDATNLPWNGTTLKIPVTLGGSAIQFDYGFSLSQGNDPNNGGDGAQAFANATLEFYEADGVTPVLMSVVDQTATPEPSSLALSGLTSLAFAFFKTARSLGKGVFSRTGNPGQAILIC